MENQIAIFEKATQMLATTIGMADEVYSEKTEKDIRTNFVMCHSRNIHRLAEDALALGKCNRLGSIYLLARPALESLFKLAAAVSNPSFAAEKVIGELLEEREKLVKWRDHSDSDGWKTFLNDYVRIYDEYAMKLRIQYNVTGDKKWKVWLVAKEGGLKSEYIKEYFMGSKHVHCMFNALCEREMGENYLPEASAKSDANGKKSLLSST